ncbi:MAG: hypothetical protein P3B76_12260 [Gemmatimonadota bacterium]|nr:hypothetical protein [Gemmatimonadota bacterium]MDQ8173448.1 hypothetical protein [Gemmatimonadota bacterium]
MNDADDTDRARIALAKTRRMEIAGARFGVVGHAPPESALVLRNFTKCTVDNRKEVSGGLL